MGPFIPNISRSTSVLKTVPNASISFRKDTLWYMRHCSSSLCPQERVYNTFRCLGGRGLELLLWLVASASNRCRETIRIHWKINYSQSFSEPNDSGHTYGWHFSVESDHKPLEIIQPNNLSAGPPTLQSRLLRIQHYDQMWRSTIGRETSFTRKINLINSENTKEINDNVGPNHVEMSLLALAQEWDVWSKPTWDLRGVRYRGRRQ